MTTSQSRQSDDHAYDYAGRELPVFRVGIGPDGRLYGSSAMPARLLRFDDAKGAFEELGELGDGEVYFFLRDRDRLLMAGYAVHAPLMSFDPRRPFRRGDPDGNPLLVRWPAVDESWRTFAAVIGADARSFWGGLAGYGKLGGPLVAWQPETGSVEVFSVGRDQSVSALGVWKDKLIVGTTILGGMGSTPTQQSARLILWDPKTGSAVFDVEVPRAVSVENAITGPDGLVYAIADRKLLVFDVAARKFVTTRPLPFSGGSVYGSLGVGPDGRIWGLAPAVPGIFVIDPRTREVRLKATVPKPITGGFAIRGRQLYFTCGGELFSYELPGPR